jgi:hypothetical protein
MQRFVFIVTLTPTPPLSIFDHRPLSAYRCETLAIVSLPKDLIKLVFP